VAERKACRKAFTPGAIETALEALDKKLLAIWDELYEFSIDHGGHPNERSLTTNLSMDDVGKTKELQVQYLHGDSIFGNPDSGARRALRVPAHHGGAVPASRAPRRVEGIEKGSLGHALPHQQPVSGHR
jgi:hypothetical protein